MNDYLVLKFLHLIGTAVLFGTGVGIAFFAAWYWDASVAKSKTAAEMRANVLKQYPGLGMEFTLNDRVAAFFPDASKAK